MTHWIIFKICAVAGIVIFSMRLLRKYKLAVIAAYQIGRHDGMCEIVSRFHKDDEEMARELDEARTRILERIKTEGIVLPDKIVNNVMGKSE